MLKKYSPVLFSILAGIFIGTSYIPFLPWAVLFSFVPLWFFWNHKSSYKSIFFSGWITQFVLTLIGFNWVAHTIHEFGQLPLWVSYIGLFAFCSFASIYIPLSGMIWLFILKRYQLHSQRFLSLLLLATITALMERFLPQIFDWNFGYTLFWAKLPMYNLAEFIGFNGLSSLLILANAFFLFSLKNWKYEKELSLFSSIGIIIVFVIFNLLGYITHQNIKKPDRQLKVLAVQANIGNQQKIYAEKGARFRDTITQKYLSLTTTALTNYKLQNKEPIDFVLWPETAFPNLLGEGIDGSRNVFHLKSRLQFLNTSLITGAYSKDQKTGQSTNSMFLLNSQGQYATPHYSKTHLLAFGEYVPFSWAFPSLPKLLPAVANFKPGKGPSVRNLNGIKIGPQICYESLFPAFSTKLAKKGAQVIVNITNDSWYGNSSEPHQHLYMTLARAIETRLPLIRGTNTGFTTAVLADGTVLESSALFEESTQVMNIDYIEEPLHTFYVRYYWLFPCLLGLLCLISIIGLRIQGDDSGPKKRHEVIGGEDFERPHVKRDRLATRRRKN